MGSGASVIPRIEVMENHDGALYAWRAAGVKQRVLVHVDAHHDMWWMKELDPITIANFICPALKEDLIREVIWVVPDATFESAQSRKPLVRHLREILKRYPEASPAGIEERRITARVLGKKLTVCPVGNLPAPGESVLLDIDIDYMVIPRVSYGSQDRHGALPWRWPEELAGQLQGIESDLVTVVYSVEGGYTPLEWKYLGDEMVLRLQQAGAGDSRLAGMDRMREGAEAEVRGEGAQAEAKYRLARELLPASAAPAYRLGRLLAAAGRVEEGRQWYRQAVARDGSYRGPYSSAGFHQYWRLDYKAAESEFRKQQALDPEDAYTHLGLGLLSRTRKRWAEAEEHLRAALARDGRLVDGHRALGELLVRQGKKQEAVTAYERALELVFKGNKPLSAPIVSQRKGEEVLDPGHCGTYIRLAALYEQNGAMQKAVNALRIAVAGGWGSAAVHRRLARLYGRQGQWRKSRAELWVSMKASPGDVWRGCGRLIRRG